MDIEKLPSFRVHAMEFSDPRNIWSLSSERGLMVSIDLSTGEITYGENYTPDEAAKVFWGEIGFCALSRNKGDCHVQLD